MNWRQVERGGEMEAWGGEMEAGGRVNDVNT